MENASGASAQTPALGQVLSAGTKFSLDNAGLVLGIWAACGLPPQLLLIAARLTSTVADKESLRKALESADWAALAPLAGAGLVAVIFGMVAHAAMLTLAARGLRGEPATVGEVLAAGVKRVPALVAASVLVGLGLGLGMLALVIPGLYLLIRMSLTIAATVIEEKGPVAALSRSWRLTAGRFWDLVGYLAVMIGLTVGASMALLAAGVVLSIVGSSAAGVAGKELAGLLVNAVQFLISAWTAACLVKLYVELAALTPDV